MADMPDLFEAIATQRALRYFRPDPIPDVLVRRVLEAGTRAPSGGNQQRWRCVQHDGSPSDINRGASRIATAQPTGDRWKT
jgi:hypothetical protein